MKFNNVLLDICRGYSTFVFDGRAIVIRHLSVIDSLGLSELYKTSIEDFVKKGKKLEADLIKDLISSKVWDASKETALTNLNEDIATLERKKRRIKEEIQIDGLYDSIEFLAKKRQKLIVERNSLLHNTAEAYANKYCLNYQLINFCFVDNSFKEFAFTEDYLEYLENYYELIGLFLEKNTSISFDSLKNLCVSPFFRNIFSFSKSENFFGKPTMDMTYPQLELLSCANCFSRAAIEHGDYPEEYAEFPEKILMWAIFRRNGGISIKEKQEKEQVELSQPIVK